MTAAGKYRASCGKSADGNDSAGEGKSAATKPTAFAEQAVSNTGKSDRHTSRRVIPPKTSTSAAGQFPFHLSIHNNKLNCKHYFWKLPAPQSP
jgi:hypothetical protein